MLEQALASPWGLLALFAVAPGDSVLPIVPSETLVVTAGALAVGGDQSLPLVIGAAALGAFTGDHVSYALGRAGGPRLRRRLTPDGRKAAALDRAGRVLDTRGGSIIVVCRYIPGARTALTLTAGAVHYPLRSFSLYDAVAVVTWGTYGTLLGYLGGSAFEDEPLKGVLLGLALAAGVAVAVEGVRHARRPNSDQPPAADST